MAVAIRQDVVGNPHCQRAIQRFEREGRPNIRLQCPVERCGTEYAVFYGPAMDVAEVQRLMVERMRARHPDHEMIVTIDEPMPQELVPLFERT